MQIADVDRAYNLFWKRLTTNNKDNVKLNKFIVSPTNQQVEEHNKTSLKAFFERINEFRSATRILRFRKPITDVI